MAPTQPSPTRPRRRWLSFSLRGFLLLILLLSIPLAWLGQKYSAMRIEDRVVDEILAADGTVIYPHQETHSSGSGISKNSNKPAPGPKWLRESLGENIFARVHCVWLTNGPFNDELVAQLPRLRELEIVILNSSSLTDRSIDSLLQVSRLKELTLDADQMSPQGLNRLSSHPTLRSLTLFGRLASPGHLRQLKPWPSLEQLTLYTTMANDEDISEIASSKNLKILNLSYLPAVTLHDPNLLAKLKQLEELSVPGGGINDLSLANIARQTELRKLDLSQTKITDVGLSSLTPLTKLKSLNVSKTQVTAQGLQALAEMKSLEEIIVSQTQAIPAGKLGSATVVVRWWP